MARDRDSDGATRGDGQLIAPAGDLITPTGESVLRKIRSYIGATFGLAVAFAACAPAATPAASGPAPGTTASTIEASDLRQRIGFLASDSLAGRDTGTPGIELAAEYLAAEARRLGLRPGGDGGTFFQSVPLQRKSTRATVTANGPAGPSDLGSDEILPVSGIGGLPAASRLQGGGPLIFGGHLVDEPLGADELGLEQLRDAVVIVRLNPPPGVDANAAPPRLAMASLFSPSSPAAAVLLVAEETEADFWDYAADVSVKGAVSLDGGGQAGPTAPPFFLISTDAAERLLGMPLADARRPRTDLGSLQYSIDDEVEEIAGRNVIAILPGADPARAGEYVTLGAHYDHVGIGIPQNGDSIFNGADDNASGTGALLEVAEALAHLPDNQRPARSVLFAWVTAEESGLLGSEHFTDNPTVPRASMIAHVNLDMVGRNSPDSIFSVGARRISTELGDLVETANRRQPQPFVFDFEFDAPGHPEQIYCRSDHYNYARYGIPILFLTSGLHDEYHAPGDEVELIDFEKAARVSRLVRDITLDLANAMSRPRVDQPVPPLGTPCM